MRISDPNYELSDSKTSINVKKPPSLFVLGGFLLAAYVRTGCR